MNNLQRVIVWRITQNCNMACQFCSYSYDIQRQRDEANTSDVENLIHILGLYKQETKHNVLVSWIGGEPFLWKHIIPYSKKLNQDFNIEVSATTNGLLLSSSKLRLDIIKYFSEIVFSLDGFSQCNDRVRKYNGHFEKVSKIIFNLNNESKQQNSNLIIKVNTILMRENIEQFESFCNKMLEIGVNEISFNQLGGFDRPEFYPSNRLLSDQVNEFKNFFPLVKEKYAQLGLKIHGNEKYLQRIIYSTENNKIAIDECSLMNWFWFINENGFISPCSYTSYEYKLSINSIKSISDIYETEQFFRKLRDVKRSRWCDDCHCTQLHDKFE